MSPTTLLFLLFSCGWVVSTAHFHTQNMCRASTLLPAAVDSDDLCTLLVAAALTALNLVEKEEH